MKIKTENKTPIPVLGGILKKIAPRIGARVLIEPKWGIVCQVTFKSGKRCYFRYNTLDLNYMGASEIARDKDYSYFFMSKMNYPTIKGKAFYSDNWARVVRSDQNIDKAYLYAQKIAFDKNLPVIVKPNSGSQGSGVALVHSKKEFYKAMNTIFKTDKIAQVQEFIKGNDYRVVVLDDQVLSAYQRLPLSVVGDGVSSIKNLLIKKQKEFIQSGRDTRIDLEDVRISTKLKHQGLNFNSIPARGEKIFLLDNANLSTGGDSVDVTDKIHPEFYKIAVDLTRDMGLRLCGVDLMIKGLIDEAPDKYFIIEVNSAPGLDHYVTIGKKQKDIVEKLYLEVLKSIEKSIL